MNRAWPILRLCLAVVLAIAAATKLIGGPIRHIGPQWTDMSHRLALGELAFGLWLLIGMFPRVLRLAALCVFCGFSLVALTQTARGAESCGCFGALRIGPAYMAAFDLSAVLALILVRPYPSAAGAGGAPAYRAGAAMALMLAATGALVLHAARSGVLAATVSAVTADQSGPAVLLPDDWVGAAFPLLRHLDAPGDLGRGIWVVLLHRADCPTCHDAMPRYRALARAGGADAQLALLQMPSQDDASDDEPGPWVSGRIRPDRQWFLTTPSALVLRDGIVLAAAQGADAVDPSGLLRSAGIQFQEDDP
jgi:hypothetical protein